MTDVEWRPTHNPTYEVSSDGRVRSLTHDTVATSRRRSWSISGVMLKPSRNPNGYLTVRLHTRGRIRETVYIHRLVAAAFHGPCPAGQEVRHLDGNRLNNAAANLTYGTRKENHADKRVHGTMARGETVSAAKLTEAQVLAIRAAAAVGAPQRHIASVYGVKQSTVSHIVNRKGWRHI